MSRKLPPRERGPAATPPRPLVKEPIVFADPHGLLASGVELDVPEGLARRHVISMAVVRLLLATFYDECPFVDRRPQPFRTRLYCIASFARVVQRERPKIEARERRHAEKMAAETEAALLRRERDRAERAASPPAARPQPSKHATTPAADHLWRRRNAGRASPVVEVLTRRARP